MDGWPIQHIGMRYHCFAQLVAKKRRVYGWMDEWTDGWMDLDGMFLRGRRLRMEGKGGVWYFGRGEWANLIPLWCLSLVLLSS